MRLRVCGVVVTVGDLGVVAGAALLVGVLALELWAPAGTAHYAEVHSPAGVQVLDLGQPRALRVPGARGASVLAVRDGAIRFVASPCPGQHCVHTGWLRGAGAGAVCVPNRVSVRLAGAGAYDAVTY